MQRGLEIFMILDYHINIWISWSLNDVVFHLTLVSLVNYVNSEKTRDDIAERVSLNWKRRQSGFFEDRLLKIKLTSELCNLVYRLQSKHHAMLVHQIRPSWWDFLNVLKSRLLSCVLDTVNSRTVARLL